MKKTKLFIDLLQWIAIIVIFVLIVFGSRTAEKTMAAPVVNPMNEIIIEYQDHQEQLKKIQKEAVVRQIDGSKMEPEREIEELKDYRLLCGIIWAEARGESLEGKKAVGIVVMNRAKSEKFPNTIEKVIYQPHQFQPVYDGNLNKGLDLYDRGEIEQDIKAAAAYALSGQVEVAGYDFTNVLYFHATRISMNNKKFVIGNHNFK